jgi:hypothetical protein
MNDSFAWILIGLGFALRMFAAVTTIDYLHPDQHFQSLEPASHIVYGYGWLSWEWTSGVRSWIIPSLYVPVLGFFKLMGVQGGALVIIACRVLTALVSSLGLVAFFTLLKRANIRPLARNIVLAVFSLHPSMAIWGAATLSDTWAMNAAVISLPAIWSRFESERAKDWDAIGRYLGLGFLARIQMALWGLGFALYAWIFKKGSPRLWVRAVNGFFSVILILGIFDWIAWGRPFFSLYQNIKKNLFEGVASMYGTSPFFEYFRTLGSDLSGAFWLAFFGCAGAVAYRKRAFFKESRFHFIFIPTAVYLFVHLLIPHKELRFIIPIYPALFFMLALMLDELLPSVTVAGKKHRLRFAVGLAIACGAMLFAKYQIKDPGRYSVGNISELVQKIHDDGKFKTGECLLLVGQYWIWTHGELMQGHPVKFVEKSPSNLALAEVLGCSYAIVLPQYQGEFDSAVLRLTGRGNDELWKMISASQRGYLLYQRVH